MTKRRLARARFVIGHSNLTRHSNFVIRISPSATPSMLCLPTASPYNRGMAEQKSWQARIGEATDAIAQTFVESMSYDWRLYKVDVAGSIAHATMLAKVGLITDADRDAIVKGLKEIEAEIDRDGPRWAGFKPELEDIHMCVESELTARIGEPGRRLHTGRSRNDQVALDLALWCDQSGESIRAQLNDLEKAFFE